MITQDFYDKWKGWINFAGMTGSAATTDTPSPRFWLLWPGVLMMVCVSFAELALQYKIFVFVSKSIWRACCSYTNALMVKTGKQSSPYLERQGQHQQEDIVEDSASEHELVKWWMWFPLLILVIIMSCVVMGKSDGEKDLAPMSR